ncbi:MAG: transcriptional regulator [Desulfobulbaceae bacterium]|nr:MAG: transcriptional regulator [Desulfobulbaceae bacterium]
MVLFHRKKSWLTPAGAGPFGRVGKNTVYGLEKGRQNVRLENLLKILQVLNIELDFKSPLREEFEREDSSAQG